LGLFVTSATGPRLRAFSRYFCHDSLDPTAPMRSHHVLINFVAAGRASSLCMAHGAVVCTMFSLCTRNLHGQTHARTRPLSTFFSFDPAMRSPLHYICSDNMDPVTLPFVGSGKHASAGWSGEFVGLLLFNPLRRLGTSVPREWKPWITGRRRIQTSKSRGTIGTLLFCRRPEPKPGPIGHSICFGKIDAAKARCKD